MAKNQRIITYIPTPISKTHHDRTVKPQLPCTPRAEYAFMRNYTLVVGRSTGNFGPANNGQVIQ